MKETYCLAIDLVASTAFGQRRSTADNERFNRALVAHLGEYIRLAGLGRLLVEFVGDGWLVRTNDVKFLPTLCCLAITYRDDFARQMAQLLGKRHPPIPRVRMSLCCGLDSEVLLPTGLPGFVGDSARLATRAGKFCKPGEILVDEPVRNATAHDFAYSEDVVSARSRQVDRRTRSQAPRLLFALRRLKPVAETSDLAKLVRALSDIHYGRPTSRHRGTPLPHNRGGAESHIDFDLAWGQLLGEPGKRSGGRVTLRHTKEVFTPPLALADESWRAMFKAFDDAASTQRQLYFKRLGRVRSWQGNKDRLVLTLEHTFYAHFLATNLNLQLPPSGKPHPILQRVDALAGEDRLKRQDFLASPLNVLAGVVSEDGILFAPRRGDHLKERPGTLQTSVGGFWEWQDEEDPFRTLQREAKEELGLDVRRDEVEFVAFGFNGQTGEPDLLAVVHSRCDRRQIHTSWLRATKGDASTAEVSLDPRRGALELDVKKCSDAELVRFIRSWRREDEWSQPSDRAAIMATLSRYVEPDRLKKALVQTEGRA